MMEKRCFPVTVAPLAVNLCTPTQALGRELMKMLLDKAVVGNGRDFIGPAIGKKSTPIVANHSIASMQNIKKMD